MALGEVVKTPQVVRDRRVGGYLAGDELAGDGCERFVEHVDGLASSPQKRGLDHIVIPGGNPPRTMLAYSLTQQFFVLHHFGIIGDGFEGAIKNFPAAVIRKALERVRRTRTPIIITRRGVPIAEVIPPAFAGSRDGWLGAMRGTATIVGDLVSPASPSADWEALGS